MYYKKWFRIIIVLALAIGNAFHLFSQDEQVDNSLLQSNFSKPLSSYEGYLYSGLEQGLTGQNAGVYVQEWSGSPGTQAKISIRSFQLEALEFSGNPYVLVNGTPFFSDPSDVTDLNPFIYFAASDIEQIIIFKDAYAVSKYGLRGANGVLDIITKKGKKGALHVTFNSAVGVQPTPRLRDVARGNSERQRLYLLTQKGQLLDQDLQFPRSVTDSLNSFYSFANDVQSPLYTNGLVHEENLSIHGGGNYGSYFLGLSNYQNDGVKENTSLKRQSVLFNAEYSISDRFTFSFFSNLSFTERGRSESNLIGSSMVPAYDNSIYFGDDKPFKDDNQYMDENDNLGLISSLELKYNLGQGWNWKSKGGLSYETARRDQYIPSTMLEGDVFALSSGKKREIKNLENVLSYSIPGDRGDFSFTLGQGLVSTSNRVTHVDGERSLDAGGSNYVKIVTGYTSANAYSDTYINNLLSFYGDVSYQTKGGLGIAAAFRGDGTSSSYHKWTYYPSTKLNYTIDSKESDISANIYASIGMTGLQMEEEVYRGEVSGIGEYYEGILLGVALDYPANKDLRHLSVLQQDYGIALDFNNRLTLDINYYRKNYSDFVYTRYLPNTSSYNAVYENGMKVLQHGLDISLGTTIISTNLFRWFSKFNASFHDSEILELPEDLQNTSLLKFAGLTKGDALTSLLGFKKEGYYNTSDEIPTNQRTGKKLSYNGNSFVSGLPRIIDSNSDGSIDQRDRQVVGNNNNFVFGGIYNDIQFKNLSISAMLSYGLGGDILTESRTERYSSEIYAGGQYIEKGKGTNYYTFYTDDIGNMIIQGISSVEDASFLRLSNVKLNYDLSHLVKYSMVLNEVHFYVAGTNLFTMSNYNGLNPTENYFGVRKFYMESTGTPLPATYSLGCKLVF